MLQSAGAGTLAAGALLDVPSPATYRLLAVAHAVSFLTAALLTVPARPRALPRPPRPAQAPAMAPVPAGEHWRPRRLPRWRPSQPASDWRPHRPVSVRILAPIDERRHTAPVDNDPKLSDPGA